MIDFSFASDYQLLVLQHALIRYKNIATNASPVRYSCIVDMIRALDNEITLRGLL